MALVVSAAFCSRDYRLLFLQRIPFGQNSYTLTLRICSYAKIFFIISWLSYVAIAVIRHRDPDNLKKKEFIWGLVSGLESVTILAGDMAASREHGARAALRTYILIHKHKAKRKKQGKKRGEGREREKNGKHLLKLQSLPPVPLLHQQGHNS